MKLTSPVFENEGNIPEKYSCKGDDINPPLNIDDIPGGTKSFAMIMDDPDAPGGTFVHWVIWNIPCVNEIGENSVPEGAKEGNNNFGKIGYGGPCPPSGTHRYYFKLYALDTELGLGEGASKRELEVAMDGHIIGQVTLMGKFSK
ncbi:MAG: YbhB/YbcL family Raf kinase inhibitor-like protein [Nanoarchaeota archaeon]